MIPKLALTTGEPAGIGPDIMLKAAMQPCSAQLVAIGCSSLLEERARQLGLKLTLTPYSSHQSRCAHTAGALPVINIPLAAPCEAGRLNPSNAGYVLAVLNQAVELCRSGEMQGMVTAPVHKGVINDAGIPFSGHTEYLRDALEAEHVVMLLATDTLRVALATTHLPLKQVPAAITEPKLITTLRVLHADLTSRFGIDNPRVTVLGLNPHAGEGGHLGSEERVSIAPACEALRQEGLTILGPIPADSAFIPSVRVQTDAYLAMYHDQGLPVIKSESFEGAVNITLGLPIIRTSVDHGTALELAGTGGASAGSFLAAARLAKELTEMANG